MKYLHCWQKLIAEPWLILPTMHKTMTEILVAHMEGKPNAFLDELMQDSKPPEMRNENGVAIIPVKGVISKDISKMERISGAVDVRDVSAMLAQAVADPQIGGIVLDMDSPGGSVTGVPELAQQISEATESKPIIAFTDSLMASAAYWIASGASAIYAAGSATVGSIGVYLALLDSSRAHEMAGYRVELIKSAGSPLKAAGMPGTSLSDEQRADLQASVDYIYGQFSGFIDEHRDIDTDAMRGQTFFGNQGIDMGLVDEIASISDAIAAARFRKT